MDSSSSAELDWGIHIDSAQVPRVLTADLEPSLWSERFSDLTFQCHDGLVRCHQLVLGSVSPTLKRIFLADGNHVHEDLHVILPDIRTSDLLVLLSILYTGSTNLFKKELSTLMDLTRLLKLMNFSVSASQRGWTQRFPNREDYHTEAVQEVAQIPSPRKPAAESTQPQTSPDLTPTRIDEEAQKPPAKRSCPGQGGANPTVSSKRPLKAQASVFECNADPEPCPTISFATIQAFTEHMRVNHACHAWKCELCGKRFKDRQNYQYHLLAHKGERTYSCDLCAKSFTNPRSLHCHRSLHSGRRFLCPYCGFKARSNSNLSGHIRTRHRERKLHCQFCNRAFATSNNLKHHLRIHTGETPYGCEICKVRFKRIHHRQSHVESRGHLEAVAKLTQAGTPIPEHLDPTRHKSVGDNRVSIVCEATNVREEDNLPEPMIKVNVQEVDALEVSESMVVLSSSHVGEFLRPTAGRVFVVDPSNSTLIQVLDTELPDDGGENQSLTAVEALL